VLPKVYELSSKILLMDYLLLWLHRLIIICSAGFRSESLFFFIPFSY
jgi:hypothetical protein